MSNKGIVAVVDDDTTVLSALSSLMRSVDYGVLTYGSAEAFLASPDIDRVCCLISDIQMPGGMNGFELQGAVSDRGFRLPVVLMTGLLTDAIGARARISGAVACLQKPIDSEILVEHVEAACTRR